MHSVQIKFVCMTSNHENGFKGKRWNASMQAKKKSFMGKIVEEWIALFAGFSGCLFIFLSFFLLPLQFYSQPVKIWTLLLAAKGSTMNLESRKLCWSFAEKPLLHCIQPLIQNVGYEAGRAATSSLSQHHADLQAAASLSPVTPSKIFKS